jgi:hypothetical protein
MRNSKAAHAKFILISLGMLAASSVVFARALAQETPSSSPAGPTRCAVRSGNSYRDVPCSPPPGPHITHGPGIQPGSRPGTRGTNPAPAKPDTSAAEIIQGDYQYNSGNLQGALWHYQQALAAHPNDPTILSRIEGVKYAIQNAENNRRFAEEAAARQREAQAREDYADRTQQLANKFQGILGDDFNASFAGNQQSAVLAESLPAVSLDFTSPSRPVVKAPAESDSGLPFTDPGITFAAPGKPVFFPVFKTPVSPNSAPARVLLANQTEVEKIDEQIHKAQEELRRLIENNKAGDELRQEYEKDSEEATTDAEGLSIKLVLDLAGGFNDELKDASEEERSEALQKILNRAPEDARNPEAQTLYAMMVDRKEQLERRAEKLRLTGKLNDLGDKIENYDKPIDEKAQYAVWIANAQAVWDTVSQSKKVEELTGPWADILDSAYTIYKQADALEHLAQNDNNNEKILVAQARLQRLVLQLVLKKQAAKARAAAQKTQPAAEAHP